jgi:hypothetical protein
MDDQPPPPTASSNFAVAYESIQHRAMWLSGVLGFSCGSTILQVLNRGYISHADGWPTISPAQWKRPHEPQSPFTAVGHLVELRRGINSMQPLQPPPPLAPADDDGFIYAMRHALPIPADPPLVVHADFKGPHPIKSARGRTHVLVLVYRNYSHLEAATGVDGASMADAYGRGLEFFAARGVANAQSRLRMDNTTSPHFRALLAKRQAASLPLIVEYVPPNVHRANRAEKAIQFFEETYLSTIMAGAHPDFPANQWDLALP